jgi:signal transduction histidine kinase/CheY-like chemotaxis protein
MTPAPGLAFLASNTLMARAMREKDWSSTSLGPPQQWPQSLRAVVNLMLGSAFPMFVAWGPQLHTLYNDAYSDILGAKHPGALGANFLDIWTEIRGELEPLVARPLAGESFYMENLPLRVRRRGFDEDTWFTFSYSPLQGDDGRIVGLYCACAETTSAVLAQKQLKERGEWLLTLFHQAPGFAAVLRGPDHTFEMVNLAYRQFTGNRDLVGLTVAQAMPEVVPQGVVGWLDQVYATGVPFVGRSVPVTVNQGPGLPLYEAVLDFLYQPLRDSHGAIEGIFVQGYDVTEAHSSREALRLADQQKDEFLATLAHELRNPLAPLLSAAHLLSFTELGEDTRHHAVDIITRQVGHMARLLDDLMDISRITQRRLLLRKEVVDVGSVVDAALEAARPVADDKRHRLTSCVADPTTKLEADPVRLTQILSNLLNNACKYTEAGGHISIDATAEGGWVTFSVTDTGIGLSCEAIKKLFVMFSQETPALERSEGGLGIGLALARELVELHGGKISAHSAGPEHGSRFEVKLPVGLAEVDDLSPAPGVEIAGRAERSILLADDNNDAADALAELLRMSGHTVHVAHDGVAALEVALNTRPEVLVLDIGMPGLNGYEVATQVRLQPWGRSSLLVAATGWGRAGDRENAGDAGFDVHLTKPFDPAQLLALIVAHSGQVPSA